MSVALEPKTLPLPLRQDETGAIRVGNSRVLLEIVIRAFQGGASPESIVRGYSTLSLSDVYLTVGYYLRHPETIDAYLDRRDRLAESVRQKLSGFKADRAKVEPEVKAGITRTERGLAIAGTRITLYDIMDYLLAEYPATLIRGILNITEEQLKAALSYIEANRVQVEAEYAIVLKNAKDIQQYWEERNRERFEEIAKKGPPPGREAAWEKLQAQKAKRGLV